MWFLKGTITLKEFLIQEAIMVAILVSGYFIAKAGQTSDVELLNGFITQKTHGTEGCCHSYPCNCRESCSGSGKNTTCTTICDTCYLHSYDVYWAARSSTGHTVYYNSCNDPSTSEPARWTKIYEREPTAVESDYTSWIKGNPESVLRISGIKDKYLNIIPNYPSVYDHYRVNRFLVQKANISEIDDYNKRLDEINSRLGAKKQVNIIVIVANTDEKFLHAVREAWLGGKKNDLIVIIGSDGDKINWSGVLSWTKNEEIKISIRDQINGLETFDGFKILNIIEREVEDKFVRRPMADFEYLASTIEPPGWAIILLFIIGLGACLGLTYYFHHNEI